MNKFQAPGETCRENIQFLKCEISYLFPFVVESRNRRNTSKSRDPIDSGDVSIKRYTSNSRAAYTSRDFSNNKEARSSMGDASTNRWTQQKGRQLQYN
jgi:hypothetical protein